MSEPKEMPWFTITAKLPYIFTQFSYEMLQEMVYDMDVGYTRVKCKLKKNERPRHLMIELLKKERDGAIEVLRLLGVEQ